MTAKERAVAERHPYRRVPTEIAEESVMVPAITLMEISSGSAARISPPLDEAVIWSEASAQDRSLPAQLASRVPPEDRLEALFLIEVRYQQHLAQRELQELFEKGALQALET
jgi:hypothetical protein